MNPTASACSLTAYLNSLISSWILVSFWCLASKILHDTKIIQLITYLEEHFSWEGCISQIFQTMTLGIKNKVFNRVFSKTDWLCTLDWAMNFITFSQTQESMATDHPREFIEYFDEFYDQNDSFELKLKATKCLQALWDINWELIDHLFLLSHEITDYLVRKYSDGNTGDDLTVFITKFELNSFLANNSIESIVWALFFALSQISEQCSTYKAISNHVKGLVDNIMTLFETKIPTILKFMSLFLWQHLVTSLLEDKTLISRWLDLLLEKINCKSDDEILSFQTWISFKEIFKNKKTAEQIAPHVNNF